MTLADLAGKNLSDARHLLALTQRAIGESNGREVQRLLAELTILGIDAMPPNGHSCNYCHKPGELYCFRVAVQRARGTAL